MTRQALVIAWLIAVPAAADAHAVGAEAKFNGERVEVEAYYDDDTPATDADVTVTDTAGGKVASGRTDVAGRWSFPTPPGGRYTVAIDAGAGHLTKLTLTVPATAPTEPASLSDGPTRAEFTGPLKWLGAATGLAVIAAGTWLARRLARTGRAEESAGGQFR